MVHYCISASCVQMVLAGRYLFKGILPVPEEEEDAVEGILGTREKYR